MSPEQAVLLVPIQEQIITLQEQKISILEQKLEELEHLCMEHESVIDSLSSSLSR